MVQAVNTYSLPVNRHHAGIINEPKEGREAPDIKTRKLLTTHPNSSIQRLFTERKEGGRGQEMVNGNILIEALIMAAQEQAVNTGSTAHNSGLWDAGRQGVHNKAFPGIQLVSSPDTCLSCRLQPPRPP